MYEETEEGGVFLGYRWVADSSGGGCPQCAALEGKEFYLNPGSGQASLEEMPELPLHPNCGCQLMPIMDYARMVGEPQPVSQPEETSAETKPEGLGEQSEALYKDAVTIFGLIFGNDGRAILDGPAYGNWCGQNWGGGRNKENMTEQEQDDWQISKPIDSLDQLCMTHDGGYAKCSENNLTNNEDCRIDHDRTLLEKTLALPEDPSQWKNPPESQEEIEHAKRYVAAVKWWFGGNVGRYDSNQRNNQEWNIKALANHLKAKGLLPER